MNICLDICLAVITGVFFMICIIVDISRARKSALESPPYGKKFIENFEDSLERISIETKHSGSVSIIVNNVKLSIKAIECEPIEGLEYSSISPYECIKLYVEDEPVVVMHILKYKYNNKAKYVEFSSKRKQSEIIEIVNLANNAAKNLIHDRYLETYGEKSFYADYSKENK